MSELASVYYVQPDTEITSFSRISSAAPNTYIGGGSYSDFFTHTNLKNYGMENLFAMNAYKITDGDFASDLYRYFIDKYPPSQDKTAFDKNRSAIHLASDMKNAIGKMLKASLGSDLPGLQNLSDEEALRSVYSVFMETFASDGGFFIGSTNTKMEKLYKGTYGADNLWGFRTALGASGTAGRLFIDDSTYTNLSGLPMPTLTSGDAVSVSGYAGTPAAAPAAGKVSCEKLYKLTPAVAPTGAPNPAILSITVNDGGDTANTTKYYVALENPVSDDRSVRHAGESGADIIPVTKGAPNIIDTDGRPAWLFVSTWFREVKNASVTYSYKNGQQTTPATAPVLSAKTDTTVTLKENAGYEYSKDGALWQSGGIFQGLQPNTQYRFYQRLKETSALLASSPSPALTVTTMKKATSGATTPSATTPGATTTPSATTPSATTPGAPPPSATTPGAATTKTTRGAANTGSEVQKINVPVVFNAYGGKTGGVKTVTISETYGAKYKLPAVPVRAGYKFSGWHTAVKGGAKITAAATVSKKAAHTLYARWTARTFTVKFNENKGKKLSKKFRAKKIKFGTKLGKLPTPKRSKYKFLGWYTKKSGGKKVTKATKMTKSGTLALYAHWKKKK
jgi:uncharacterized repeat protein (TIGR02543 family)